MAELLRHEGRRRPGARQLAIASAGVDARFGDAAASGSQSVASSLGLSLADHCSQPLRDVDIRAAELILTMTSRQTQIVHRSASDLATRTFAVRELDQAVDRILRDLFLKELVTGAGSTSERLQVLARLADSHRPNRRRRRRLDVPDPLGDDAGAYQRMAEEFVWTSRRLGLLLFGQPRTR